MYANDIWRLKGRLYAPFHVQVEMPESHLAPSTPAYIVVTAKVMRLFRGDGRIQVGDEIKISVHVSRPHDGLAAGAYPSQPRLDADRFAEARFLEAFLSGKPPEYGISRDQLAIIPEISDIPYMPLPTEAELDESNARKEGEDLDINW